MNLSSFLFNDFILPFHSEPPVALTRPQNMIDKLESFAGKPIVLEIEVSRPNAEVSWWLNGEEIEESSNVIFTEDGLIRRLTIHSPSPADSGKYTCDAVDDKIDFQVKVSGKRQLSVVNVKMICGPKGNQSMLLYDYSYQHTCQSPTITC